MISLYLRIKKAQPERSISVASCKCQMTTRIRRLSEPVIMPMYPGHLHESKNEAAHHMSPVLKAIPIRTTVLSQLHFNQQILSDVWETGCGRYFGTCIDILCCSCKQISRTGAGLFSQQLFLSPSQHLSSDSSN